MVDDPPKEPQPAPVAPSTVPRTVARSLPARETSEGAGVTVWRSLGFEPTSRCDPFLLLDEIKVPGSRRGGKAPPTAAFPPHPHRGFCTLTLMLNGSVEHADSLGNRGRVGGGGAQWMSAGRGVIHSEEVTADGDGDGAGGAHGLQLWINVHAEDKLSKPRYQDVAAEDVPVVKVGGEDGGGSDEGAEVRVLAGEVDGVRGPLKRHPGTLLMVRIGPGKVWRQWVDPEWTAFLYLIEGQAMIGGSSDKTSLSTKTVYDLALGGDEVTVTAGKRGAALLFAAAPPLREPIFAEGPFVMSTQAELDQTMADLRSGKFAKQVGGGGGGSGGGGGGSGRRR